MGAHAVITHALTPGTRMHYAGTQSWGPRNVTVIKPWGGHADPLYVVRPDGMGEHCTYVVSEGELRPMRPVTLAKITDAGVRECDVEVSILLADGGAWMDSSLREVREFRAQGFMVAHRIRPAR